MRRLLLIGIMMVLYTNIIAQPKKLLGGDVSLLPSYEAQHTVYKDFNGRKVSFLPFVKQQGWNAIRVRLFVDPANAPDGHKDEGVCQDLSYVIRLSRQVKKAGMQLMLDFHYSDTWADPGKQFTPHAWQQADRQTLTDSVYAYTRRVLQAMKKAGVAPDLIQVGNEITNGLLWPTGKLDPTSDERSYYQHLRRYGVDYDIIGLSYYPMWHKSIPNLGRTLDKLAWLFPDKPVMIVEAAAYYSHDNDHWAKPDQYAEFYPISVEGQTQYTQELVEELNKHHNVTGLFWWFPEENGFGNSVTKGWLNRGLFDNKTGQALPALKELSRFK